MSAKARHCFEFLLAEELPLESGRLPEVVVAYGDDAFLRRETVRKILSLSQIAEDEARGFDGAECRWVDVHDELATLSLFATCDRRTAIVSAADKLVKDARGQLEKWTESPAKDSLLVMQLGSFPANTKLFKSVAKHGLCLNCSLPTSGPRSKTPSMSELKKWLVAWGQKEHQLKLTSANATLILDAVGPDCGLLHQELAKLSLYATKGKLTEEQIQQNVGSLRTRTAWEIADAIVDGHPEQALEHLHRLLASGEHPAAIVPQVAWSLRRYGTAAQLILQSKRQGQVLNASGAISQCGFYSDRGKAEARLKRLGLNKASKILGWLLELDLKIKGSHSTPQRAAFAIEELCLRFA